MSDEEGKGLKMHHLTQAEVDALKSGDKVVCIGNARAYWARIGREYEVLRDSKDAFIEVISCGDSFRWNIHGKYLEDFALPSSSPSSISSLANIIQKLLNDKAISLDHAKRIAAATHLTITAETVYKVVEEN